MSELDLMRIIPAVLIGVGLAAMAWPRPLRLAASLLVVIGMGISLDYLHQRINQTDGDVFAAHIKADNALLRLPDQP